MDIRPPLAKSSRDHFHLCPRQFLGVRIVFAGVSALVFDVPPAGKRLLVITGTDGCFADGVIAATECSVGHSTLHVEDYGKVAATFVDAQTGLAGTAGVPARSERASGRARCAVFAAHR